MNERTAEVPQTPQDRIEDLSRGALMKMVVSEPLSRHVAPLYEPLANEDITSLSKWFESGDIDVASLQDWTVHLASIAEKNTEENGLPTEIELINAKRRIFFFDTGKEVESVSDGARSGIVVPVLIATHILVLEKVIEDAGFLVDWLPNHVPRIPAQGLAAIMQRPNFNDILLDLSKGQNGFLGDKSSTNLDEMFNAQFFDFSNPHPPTPTLATSKALGVKDAYKFTEGRVTGLSDLYYEAAHYKRQQIKEAGMDAFPDGYNGADSTGCLFRFAYKDEGGVPQDAIILQSKQFVIDALLRSSAVQGQAS